MALFGGKKSLLEGLLANAWASPEEKDELLRQLRANPPKGAELVPLLWHGDPAVRKLGAILFLERADGAATGRLLQELATRPPAARTPLLPILGRLQIEVLRATLDELIQNGAPEVRKSVWELALATPEPLRAAYLRRALSEAPAALRLKAMQEWISGGATEENLDLLLTIAGDKDRQMGLMALEALRSVQHPKVLALMLERLAEGNGSDQAVASAYLQTSDHGDARKLQGSLLEALTRGNRNTRKAAIETLLQSNDSHTVTLAVLRRCGGLPGWRRKQILESVAGAGSRILDAAVGLMKHDEPLVRHGAIMMVADGFQDPSLVEPFCRLLGDEDWWLRVTACQALGRLVDERSVPFLVKALEDEDTRWAAVDALAQIGATSALKPLSRLLRDPREEVRQEVLEAFSRFNDQRLISVLASVRDHDSSPTVRQRAGEILLEMAARLNVPVKKSTAELEMQRLGNHLEQLLSSIRTMGASDLHLSVGEPPVIRVDGVLRRMKGMGKLSSEVSRKYILSLFSETQQAELETNGALDFCHEISGVGRYRANAYVQRLGLCASFRVIADRPATFEELRLPEQLRELTEYHQGVIVISGPTSSGKSTTLAALVNLVNETKAVHVITLEDPIEIVHPPKLALINQRQVGRDTAQFATGLRAALREDPDVIVVGELRDPDTIRMALEAAETGHVVITTLHTASAVQTIDRLVDSFPPDEQAQVRTALSESLKYIVCQRLIPRKDAERRGPGKGRVALFEILKGTFSIGNKIRKAETFQIPGMMQIGRHVGMQTRDQALTELLEADIISAETAYRYAEKPATFASQVDPGRVRETTS
jgi:twitching motility protein PilT